MARLRRCGRQLLLKGSTNRLGRSVPPPKQKALGEGIGSWANPPLTTPPRSASTLVMARQTPERPQVLLVQRLTTSAFGAGAWVFPGGAVDADDSGLLHLYPALATGMAARMGLTAAEAAAYLGAAVREAWEETGILIGAMSPTRSTYAAAADLPVRRLLERETSLPDLESIVYVSRWVTPPGQSRRYDTRFFVAEVGGRFEPRLSSSEHAEARWMRPAEALQRNEGGEIVMMPPTVHTLRTLREYDSVTAMLQHLRERPAESYFPLSAPATEQ